LECRIGRAHCVYALNSIPQQSLTRHMKTAPLGAVCTRLCRESIALLRRCTGEPVSWRSRCGRCAVLDHTGDERRPTVKERGWVPLRFISQNSDLNEIYPAKFRLK
jgi:hypothetical protein